MVNFNSERYEKKIFMVILFSILFSVVIISSINAQDDPKAKLDQAEQYYKSAQFDNAIEILNNLAADNNVDVENFDRIVELS